MERVLEWRENLEKDSMEKFAVKQNELAKEKSILDNLKKEYEHTKQKLLKRISIEELRQIQLYKQMLEDKIDNQIQVVNRKTIELENVRNELIDAQKERKIMEKLKERDYSNYQEELKAFEQKQLDEMAVLKFKVVEN